MSTIPLDLETDVVQLPKPSFPIGATLEKALAARHSSRMFRSDALPVETLATLLWAGCGVNRQETGHRTAPSARNWQEIVVYTVMAEGAYQYDPIKHDLHLVSAADLREATGLQDFVGTAPLNLVYVADYARMHDCKIDDRTFFAGADAAVVAQNVSLYCASAGLSTVIRALIDRQNLATALRLQPSEHIALAQTVGWAVGQS